MYYNKPNKYYKRLYTYLQIRIWNLKLKYKLGTDQSPNIKANKLLKSESDKIHRLSP